MQCQFSLLSIVYYLNYGILSAHQIIATIQKRCVQWIPSYYSLFVGINFNFYLRATTSHTAWLLKDGGKTINEYVHIWTLLGCRFQFVPNFEMWRYQANLKICISEMSWRNFENSWTADLMRLEGRELEMDLYGNY